ncbi:PP2C family protein-serine/threonine phosphatase [Planctomycetota bacterium]
MATKLNKRFPFENNRQQFFTLLLGILDIRDGTFKYVSAGHPPLLHIPKKGPATISRATGFPIGVMDNPAYVNHSLQLQPGDRLYLYSDGVNEAGERSGQPWGIQGLCDFVATQGTLPLGEILDRILAETHARHHKTEPPDDVSLVALELK